LRNIIQTDPSSRSTAGPAEVKLLCAGLWRGARFHAQDAVGRANAHDACQEWHDANPAPGANASCRGQANQDQPNNNSEDAVDRSNIDLHGGFLLTKGIARVRSPRLNGSRIPVQQMSATRAPLEKFLTLIKDWDMM
jgi:hypothetical protein